MTAGIGASLTTVSPGTTIRSADAMANWNAINNAGVSNDGGSITTGSGIITAVGLRATNGGTLDYFISPVLILSNVTINQNATNTSTYTNTGGIPSGAKAVHLAFAFTTAALNAHAQFTPHGSTISDTEYPQTDPRQTSSSTVTKGAFCVPVDANGQIDIKAINGQITACYVRVYGYNI